MKHQLTNIGLVAVFALGASALGQVVINAPAFNAELRRDNAFGDTLVLFGRDMYDHPAYLYQQAASYVHADLVTLDAGETGSSVASLEVGIARAGTAIALLQESLSMDPGNAGAWTVLAWGHLMSGKTGPAMDALSRSWQLAPYNIALAEERLALGLTLLNPTIAPSDAKSSLSDDAAIGLVRDLETLWVQRRGRYGRYAEEAQSLGLPIYTPPSES